ncbi:MAG: zinc ribbon domain-containing protein [Anaerolineales bacterium]|nr:zinc ribbon domain-containing protein [Anaerolineales bacterium]
MGKKKAKPKLTEPWRRIHGAIWLIGIAILAWQNWWWPGILVLVALSSILEAILMQKMPGAFESEGDQEVGGEEGTSTVAESSSSTRPYPFHLLPSDCPKCGAPLGANAVQWDHPNAAHCPYCGVLLPLREQTA